MWERIENLIIFHPVRGLQVDPSLEGLDYEEISVETADGVRLHGWFLPAAGSPTILYLHGNAGNITDRLSKAACLVSEGYPVLLMDYRGYGLSEGHPTEEGVYRDALAMYAHLVEERGLPENEIAVWGMSLGGTVAVDLASRVPVGRLIVESTFTSATDLARVTLPWWPSRLIRARLDSVSKVPSLRLPKLFIHGERDEIVPFDHGRRLFEQAAEPKRFLALPRAGHNDTWLAGGAAYLETIAAFLRADGPD
jgi:fermentation-respiration switch protein FrsA (DUF1100 family)